MGFINCKRDCAYEQLGNCTLDDIKDAAVTCDDDECVHYLKRISPDKKGQKSSATL